MQLMLNDSHVFSPCSIFQLQCNLYKDVSSDLFFISAYRFFAILHCVSQLSLERGYKDNKVTKYHITNQEKAKQGRMKEHFTDFILRIHNYSTLTVIERDQCISYILFIDIQRFQWSLPFGQRYQKKSVVLVVLELLFIMCLSTLI